MQNISLSVEKDHIKQKYLKDINRAVIELLCNSLDADAKKVEIMFQKNAMGGITKIIVCDNGRGITYFDAVGGFGKLGFSEKASTIKSEGGRIFLGKKGEGRLYAMTICSKISWNSVYKNKVDNKNYEFSILNENSSAGFEIKDEVVTTKDTGMIVELENISSAKLGKFKLADLKNTALHHLAHYIKAYEGHGIEIIIDGEKLDLKNALESDGCEEDILVKNPEDNNSYQFHVQLFHWKDKGIHERYFLDDKNEIIMQDGHTGFSRQEFGHSVFITGEYISKNSESFVLVVNTSFGTAIQDAVKVVIENYYKNIHRKRAIEVVEQAVGDDYYPYDGAPKNPIEQSERELFDVILYEIASNSQQFSKDSIESKKVVAHLLKRTIERDVKDVLPIFSEALKLSESDIQKLNTLIQQYGFSHVINVAKVVSDKLAFIKELNLILFDPLYKKATLERQHLHKLIENELWIFGDGYSEGTSDQKMEDVLKSHIKLLGREDLIGKDSISSDDRPDIMLNKQYPQSSEGEYEHLIVELKRPLLKLTSVELDQVKRYASQILNDHRFDKNKTKWKFILLGSNGYDDVVEMEINQTGKPKGCALMIEGCEIWVKTWGELLQGLEWKFHYLQSKVAETSPDSRGFAYIGENYPELMESINKHVHEHQEKGLERKGKKTTKSEIISSENDAHLK